MTTLDRDGFTFIPGVLPSAECTALAAELGDSQRAGRRGILALEPVSAIANSPDIIRLLRPHLPTEPRAVRAIFFDKSAEVNWLVAWHQDLTIAVHEKRDVPGFGPWSVKDGIPHVQPPAELLAQMLTIRIHLDDADEENGALRVLPGSHRHGRLDAAAIQRIRANSQEVLCCAKPGDALLMRPLILHASARSTSARRRQILHIEYAGFTLADGLLWHEAS